MRKKKAFINIFFSLLLEVVTVVSGFIVPRLFILFYGSEVNGLINSITSFVGYITLLQAGVGSVIKAALYKPLAKKNHDELCVIIKTAENFFRKIAIATVIYLAVLAVVFSVYITSEYGWIYSASLVVIIGISTAAQYFFGISYQMLLEADQRSYVYSLIQIITVIVNTIAVVIFTRLGLSVQLVKLASAIFFVLRPLVMGLYSKKYYKINTHVKPNNDLIKQRWDGFAQAIAYFIHSKTDVFVLTIFSTLTNVSVYSVYAMVTAGLSALINAIDKAVRSAFGNIIACDEQDNLIKSFNTYSILLHMLSTAFFATASITVFNFMGVYVKNVSDADYIQPLFGLLIIAAEYLYCLRTPYNSIIYAAGKFKETKVSAGLEAVINIVISVILVQKFELVGVAIGTIIAMAYRTIAFIVYLHKDVLRLKYMSELKRYGISLLSYLISIFGFSRISIETGNYFEWVIYAAIVFVLTAFVSLAVNMLFNYKETKYTIKRFLRH